jgi:Na+/H+ antiporter family protein
MLILLGFAAGKVSPTQLIPLLWYQLLLAIFTMIYIFVPQISNKTLKIIDKK